MKIYSMTATFGKLENQTLTLEPGLNIINAPNEWGKSTWCAFLVTMLYGIDTGARSKKGVLADKERYAPWSGAPMSGRMEINWDGRDITLERRAKGRTPMGEFSAYETATGLPVAELTATTCGEALLGVERSVFQRSGFISLSDLPVTQDDSLRRRLNALVTTGDESNASDDLAQKLKDLKNKCRYNRSGLLPQAESQRDSLERDVQELSYLQNQSESIQKRQKELESFASQLENHKKHLAYGAALEGQRKVAAAVAAREQARERVAQLESECAALPQQAPQKLAQAKLLWEQQRSLELEGAMLPQLPEAPEVAGRPVTQVRQDLSSLAALEKRKKTNGKLVWIYIVLAVAALALLLVPALGPYAWGICAAVAVGGVAILVICALRTRKIRDGIEALYDLYPGLSPDKWLAVAQVQEEKQAEYARKLQEVQLLRAEFAGRKAALGAQISAFAPEGLQTAMDRYARAEDAQEALLVAHRAWQQAAAHVEALGSLVSDVPKPEGEDSLTFPETDTLRLIADTAFELRQLSTRLGQCQGKMEALGSRERLEAQLETVNRRIQNLTDTYQALDLALRTVGDASDALQRRFAPRISQRAQTLFSRLTGGRYDRLQLQQDLSIQAGTSEEPTVRPALWRSEGTIDQLYLALRLAVSGELTPQAPLVLDDAFARFDDDRLAAAMELLREEARTRQVILFTCQNREK